MATRTTSTGVPPATSPTQTIAPTTTTPSTTQPPPPPAGPPRPRPDALGHIVDRLQTQRKVVALTFDAGANNAGVASILATLRASHAPATFFLTGHWSQTYPAQARLVASRHPVGNHTVGHPDLTKLPLPEVRREVVLAQRQITSLAGRDPRPLFRFPYGAYDPARLGLVNQLGYAAVGWTVDTLGWEGTSGGQSASTVLARVLAGLQPGEIILMHVGSNPTDHSTLDADALPAIIRAVRARGYTLTALPPYLQAR